MTAQKSLMPKSHRPHSQHPNAHIEKELRWIRKLPTEMESGGIVTASAMKLSDWMDEWLRLYLPNIEKNTRDSYRDKIDSLINF